MDAAILFAPAGELVPQSLAQLQPGGTVVCAGIHMSDIPSFPYRLVHVLLAKDREQRFADAGELARWAA